MSNDRKIYTIKGRFNCLNRKRMVIVKIDDKAVCVMSEEEYDNIVLDEKKNHTKDLKNRKYVEKYRKLS